MSAEAIPVGKRGVALDDILPDNWGKAWFPELGEKSVRAITEIRAGAEIIIIEGHAGAREASPYELKFERYIGLAGSIDLFYRATEENRYPVADSGVKDDYHEVMTALATVTYVVGTDAYARDPSVPWGQRFVATTVTILCAQNSWVRFNGQSRVEHYVPAGVPTTWALKVTALWIRMDTIPGLARIWMVG